LKDRRSGGKTFFSGRTKGLKMDYFCTKMVFLPEKAGIQKGKEI